MEVHARMFFIHAGQWWLQNILFNSYLQFTTPATEREKQLRDIQHYAPRVYENEYRCLNKTNVGEHDHVSTSRVRPPHLFFWTLFWAGKTNQDVSAAFHATLYWHVNRKVEKSSSQCSKSKVVCDHRPPPRLNTQISPCSVHRASTCNAKLA